MARYSNKTWICPFFHSDDKAVIRCDGGRLIFKSHEDLCAYANMYCCSYKYKDCSIARHLLARYEEDVNE